MKSICKLIDAFPPIIVLVGVSLMFLFASLFDSATTTPEEIAHSELWDGKLCKNGVLYYALNRGATPAYDKDTKQLVMCEDVANY